MYRVAGRISAGYSAICMFGMLTFTSLNSTNAYIYMFHTTRLDACSCNVVITYNWCLIDNNCSKESLFEDLWLSQHNVAEGYLLLEGRYGVCKPHQIDSRLDSKHDQEYYKR